ncbi:MAG: sulfatase [Desulfuromonadaceae bacterium]|nr:sulfatase [Desulfuromonadaceae bacterium]
MKSESASDYTIKIVSMFLFFVMNICCVGLIESSAEEAPVASERYKDTNVILVSLQCLRPDHLGVYGYKRDTSPNIDRLAESSILFDNTIAQANLTPVAMMSVLTSQYPRVNGMIAFDVAKDAVSSRTLPEILKYYGYTTAAVSGSPEFFMRYDTESGTEIKLGDVFSRSFDYFGRTRKGLGSSLRVAPVESLDWIQKNRGKKFFMWIASGVIHVPYAAGVPREERGIYDPPEYTPFWEKFHSIKAKEGASDDTTYDVLMRIYNDDYYLGFKPVYKLTEKDYSYIVSRYDAAIRYTDNFIGQLVSTLEKNGLSKNTILIIHSIHGEDLGERGTYVHYDLSESAVKSALLVHLPDGEHGGKRIAEQVQGLDIMPTLLDYLGIPRDYSQQGSTLLPLINGEAGATGSEYAYIDRIPWWEHTLSRWYLEFKNSQTNYPESEKQPVKDYASKLKVSFPDGAYPPGDIAIRTKQWKLILRKEPRLLEVVSWYSYITGIPLKYGDVEIYNILEDPYERHNVAAQNPKIVDVLKGKLLEWDTSVVQKKAVYGVGEKRYIIPYP